MNIDMQEQTEWNAMSPEDRKVKLFLNQKEVLDKFLERGAITRAQYDKSFGDLVEKMGMEEYSGK